MNIEKKTKIRTERLVLTSYDEKDLESLTSLLMNKEISKTFMIPDYKTKEEYINLARKLIQFSKIEDKKHLEYGIFLDGQFIGFINDCGYDEKEIEVGYVIDPLHRGNGYATEALQASIQDLFDMGFEKVKAGYFIENEASHRVMLKAGMRDTDEEDSEEYRSVLHRVKYCEINK